MIELIYSKSKVDEMIQSLIDNPNNFNLLNIIRTVIVANLPPNFSNH